MTKIRYSDFAHKIDIDAFEQAIGFEPTSHDRGWDNGYCLWPENHKHGDTTGKFGIHREAQTYNCYVCGGGSLLSLAMEVFGSEVDEATHWLYQFTHGEQRSSDDFADYLLAMLDDADKRVETMPYFNDRVLERFDGPTDYFRGRGISDEIIERYHLCYGEAVDKPAPLKVGRDGVRHKIDDDYCGPASIWPHYWMDRLVGWQYRWHDWDEAHSVIPKWLPKWTNTTDFPKSTTLFNYRAALRSPEPVVVVESLGTVLFLASYDIPAVAYFGSKPTPEQLRLIRRFTQGVILAPDNDSNLAGDKILGTVQYLERFIPVGIAVKLEPEDVCLPPGTDGIDIGDFANCDDAGALVRDYLKYCVHPAGLAV